MTAARWMIALGFVVAGASDAVAQTNDNAPLPRTAWGQPDIGGTWDFRTISPLERPDALSDREFLTGEEAAAFVRAAPERTRAFLGAIGDPDAGAEIWVDPDARGDALSDGRTALLVAPVDGKLPLNETGQAARAAILAAFRDRPSGPEDRTISERCLMWAPTPVLNGPYNINLQIFQTEDYVAVYHEMMHDVRIIPLDGRPPISTKIDQLRGDSRGHWENDTLVVETSHFNPSVRSA